MSITNPALRIDYLNRFLEVYNDLPHPPDTYVGHKYAFRTADGSNNNPAIPNLGKADTPYARSVPQTHPLPRNELPDAGLVFDTLLRREGVRSLYRRVGFSAHACF